MCTWGLYGPLAHIRLWQSEDDHSSSDMHVWLGNEFYKAGQIWPSFRIPRLRKRVGWGEILAAPGSHKG